MGEEDQVHAGIHYFYLPFDHFVYDTSKGNVILLVGGNANANGARTTHN